MPYNFGSSSTSIEGLRGPIGTQGVEGPTGEPGDTGNIGPCLSGPTGIGITDIKITGLTLQIIYGTGGYTFEISKNIIQGDAGTTLSNDTQYTIRGITTSGFSILNTTSLVEFAANSITYAINIPLNSTTPEFYGLSFDGISYSSDKSTITLLALTETTSAPLKQIGSVLYKTSSATDTATGVTWDSINNIFSYKKLALREVDISGYTFSQDNYRKTNISPLSSESGYVLMKISGYTFDSNLARPISTINGTTHQSALYINGISGGITGRSIVYFGKKTGTYGTTFSPQTVGITFGSCCLPSGKCIEYATTQYCNSFSGSTFSAGVSCGASKCGFKSCCFYDIVSGGITCKDSDPNECIRFLGITGASLCMDTTCSTELCCRQPTVPATAPQKTYRLLNNITNIQYEEDYAIKGRCCFGGKCYRINTNSTKVQYIPSITELVFIGYDTCSSFIGPCCTTKIIDGITFDDCFLTTAAGCDDLMGSFLGADKTCEACNE